MKAILAAWLLTMASVHAGAVVVEASGDLPSDARDQLGDTVGSIGSGLVYDAKSDLFFCIPDRGPGDGTLPYRPRFIKLQIKQNGTKLETKVIESVLFRDEMGREMTGLIPTERSANVPRTKDGRICLDPEAIALAHDGTLYVTDEYGPFLYQFQQDGKLIRRITLPENFRPLTDDGKLDFHPEAKLKSGRNINQGPEGLCLLPHQKIAALAFQSGLMQEGGRHSLVTKILLVDLESGAAQAEYLYTFETHIPGTNQALDLEKLSVNDMACVDDTHFLVLERDGTGRDGSKDHSPAKYKAVWLVDTTNATNLLKRKARETHPVKKTLLFNLPELVPNPSILSAKWEGITIVPPISNHEVTLMMAADNDFLNPVVHEAGREYPFPRVKDSVPSQFYKIRADLSEKP